MLHTHLRGHPKIQLGQPGEVPDGWGPQNVRCGHDGPTMVALYQQPLTRSGHCLWLSLWRGHKQNSHSKVAKWGFSLDLGNQRQIPLDCETDGGLGIQDCGWNILGNYFFFFNERWKKQWMEKLPKATVSISNTPKRAVLWELKETPPTTKISARISFLV